MARVHLTLVKQSEHSACYDGSLISRVTLWSLYSVSLTSKPSDNVENIQSKASHLATRPLPLSTAQVAFHFLANYRTPVSACYSALSNVFPIQLRPNIVASSFTQYRVWVSWVLKWSASVLIDKVFHQLPHYLQQLVLCHWHEHIQSFNAWWS